MWVVAFYVFSALCILFFLGFSRLLSHSKFRSDDDRTTEVGYEEDSVGNLRGEDSDSKLDDWEEPHMGVEKIVQ
jgi:hypothetical protein